jgi:hypothetical protein
MTSLVDLDGFLTAAVGHGDHQPGAHGDDGPDGYPHSAYVREDSEFPERREDTGKQEDVTEEESAHPFHCRPSMRTRRVIGTPPNARDQRLPRQ